MTDRHLFLPKHLLIFDGKGKTPKIAKIGKKVRIVCNVAETKPDPNGIRNFVCKVSGIYGSRSVLQRSPKAPSGRHGIRRMQAEQGRALWPMPIFICGSSRSV